MGRSPHEVFFRPDGRELWVAVRGENYVSVIDPAQKKEVRRIETANGTGMVLFRPDGKFAFVPSSFTPEMAGESVFAESCGRWMRSGSL